MTCGRGSVWPAAVAGVLLLAASSSSQVRERPPGPAPTPFASPRPEAVAETKLLMAGLTKPNFDGLTRMLREKPADAEAWGFARGQALIVAESANLLMLRPPSAATARETWLMRAADLREAGVKAARAAGEKNYLDARSALAGVANACNRCHAAFQVPVRLNPSDPPN